MIWNHFSLKVLCLTFFVSKFHGSELNSLSTTSNWSKKGISRKPHFQLKISFFNQESFSLICSHLKMAWSIDARLFSNGRWFDYLSFETNLPSMALAALTSEASKKKLSKWKKSIIMLELWMFILLQTDVMNKLFNSDPWNFDTKNVKHSSIR